MKYNYSEDEEIIRPRKSTPKVRKPKSDHKHIYTQNREKWMEASNVIVLKETCTICGREGKLHFFREELGHE